MRTPGSHSDRDRARPTARLAGLAGLVVLPLLALGVTPQPAGAADAPAAAAAGSSVGSAEVTVPVPDGVSPRRIIATLDLDQVEGRRVQLLVDGRPRTTAPARRHSTVRVPVRAADVRRDGAIELSVRYPTTAATRCVTLTPVGASLTQVRLVSTGSETAPRTVGDFFSDATSRVDVVVAPRTDDPVLAAGLAAVAALAARYPTTVPVQLVSGDVVLPRVGAGQRVVRFAEAARFSTQVSQRFGLWTLTVKGSPDQLLTAARAFVRPDLRLVRAADLRVLDGDATRAAASPEETTGTGSATDQTLADLGTARVQLSGYGRTTRTIVLPQDLFGGPVRALDLHLVGTHTAVPAGSTAQLDVHLNGFLLGSVDLTADDGTDLDLTLHAPASLLQSVNRLDLTLSGIPASTLDCSIGGLPLEVDIDGSGSEVTATPGAGDLSGFALFPQALGGELPLAIRSEGAARVQSAVDASLLVAALQRDAALPLTVDLVDADAFLADDVPGLLVDADYDDSVALRAPLRLDGREVVKLAGDDLRTRDDRPFVTLETTQQNDRDVVLLGSWAPQDQALPEGLSRRTAQQVAAQGWSSLDDDLLVATKDQEPVTLQATGPAESAADATDSGDGTDRSYLWWFAAAVVVMLGLLAGQLAATVRKDRRVRALVDAQQRADASGLAGPSEG